MSDLFLQKMACKVLTWHCRRRAQAVNSDWLCASSLNSAVSHLTVFFLPQVCRPNALYRESITGRKTGWQQRAGSSVAGWGKCRRDKMPWPGWHATVAKGARQRLRWCIHALKMQQNTGS